MFNVQLPPASIESCVSQSMEVLLTIGCSSSSTSMELLCIDKGDQTAVCRSLSPSAARVLFALPFSDLQNRSLTKPCTGPHPDRMICRILTVQNEKFESPPSLKSSRSAWAPATLEIPRNSQHQSAPLAWHLASGELQSFQDFQLPLHPSPGEVLHSHMPYAVRNAHMRI